MIKDTSRCYCRHRFAIEIVSHAVWLYHRFCLSFRDVEDLLAKSGIVVTHETIRQWCRKLGPDYARKLRRRQGRNYRLLRGRACAVWIEVASA